MQLVHRCDERRTVPILRMRKKWGDRGYGWLWCIREALVDTGFPVIAWEMRYLLACSTDALPIEFDEFLDDCINVYGLLESDGRYIWDIEHVKVIDRSLTNAYKLKIRQMIKQGKFEHVDKIKEKLDKTQTISKMIQQISKEQAELMKTIRVEIKPKYKRGRPAKRKGDKNA